MTIELAKVQSEVYQNILEIGDKLITLKEICTQNESLEKIEAIKELLNQISKIEKAKP